MANRSDYSENQLADALRRLPHGAEFRFVDRLLELDPGKSGAAEYAVRGSESFLRGHFPGDPLFPGVLLIEAAAQLAGIVAQSDPVVGPLPNLKLAGVRALKIIASARPGQKILLRARVTGRLGALVHAQISASVEQTDLMHGEVIMSGDAAA